MCKLFLKDDVAHNEVVSQVAILMYKKLLESVL